MLFCCRLQYAPILSIAIPHEALTLDLGISLPTGTTIRAQWRDYSGLDVIGHS